MRVCLVVMCVVLSACSSGDTSLPDSGQANVGIAKPPANLSYSPSALICTRSVTCELLPPVGTGGAPTDFAIAPALPDGFVISKTTGAVSGVSDTMVARADYTVTASNAAGSTSTHISVQVNDAAPTSVSYSTATATCFRGQPCGPLNATTTGGGVTNFSITPTLPTGVTLNATSGVIAGTPSGGANRTTYTVTAANGGGEVTTTISLEADDFAQITGVPSDISAVPVVAATVSGIGVVSYRYRFSRAGCTGDAGYSAVLPSGAAIAEPLADLVDTAGSLCVVGGDDAGRWQPFDQATSATFVDHTEPLAGGTSDLSLMRNFNVPANTVAESLPVRFTGVSGNASCSSCTVSVNDGGFALNANVVQGDLVRVRQFSGNTASSDVSAQLKWLGAGAWTFVLRTAGSACTGKRLFLTGTTTTGSLGGRAGADAICQAEAVAHGAGGSTWRALIGGPWGRPPAQMSGTYCTFEGTTAFDGTNFVGLSSTDIAGHPILYATDAFGPNAPSRPRTPHANRFWYGIETSNCASWSSSDAGVTGQASAFTPSDPNGNPLMLMQGGVGPSTCDEKLRLLCAEQ